MNESNGLPKGWVKATIAELIQPLEDGRILHHGWSPQCEKGPSQSEADWGVLKTTAIQEGQFLPEHNKRLPSHLSPRPHLEVKQGDMLITCAGPRNRCGIPCLVRSTRCRLILSGKMYRFRAFEGSVNPSYLEAFLRTQEAQAAIDKMKTGISDSGLNLTHDRFFGLRVPLAPLNEQSRIVAKIEELFSDLDAGVAALERVKANLKRYRASVLKAAVEGRLTEEWRKTNPPKETAAQLLQRILQERRHKWEESQFAAFSKAGKSPPKDWKDRYKEPAAPEESNLPELPKGWCWATVEAISTKVADGVHKKPNYVENGIPFIKVHNLTAGPGIDFNNVDFITITDHQQFIERTNPEYGDILISKDGTLGVVRAVRTKDAFSIFVSIALVKPVDKCLSDYFEIAFTSQVVQVQMIGKGIGLQHIHLEDLRKDCIPIPPLCEQDQIVNEAKLRLSIIEELEVLIDKNMKRSSRLRQSILKQAFEGKLVPQDPKDEPASTLLERIKATTRNGKPKKATRTSRKK
jgi:type I restriction enzyme, S subunit